MRGRYEIALARALSGDRKLCGRHMIPRRIAGATHHLGAPQSWDEATQGPCRRLHVRVSPEGICESAWEPTPAELAALNAGASIILSVVGGQPPVMLSVEAPLAEDKS